LAAAAALTRGRSSRRPWEGARGRAGCRTCRPRGGGALAHKQENGYRRRTQARERSFQFVWVTRVTAGTSAASLSSTVAVSVRDLPWILPCRVPATHPFEL